MKTNNSFPAVRPARAGARQRIIEAQLGVGGLYELQGDHRGDRIDLTAGMVWITQPGDPEDHLLQLGDSLLITRPGRVIAQGMAESKIRIISRG